MWLEVRRETPRQKLLCLFSLPPFGLPRYKVMGKMVVVKMVMVKMVVRKMITMVSLVNRRR